MFDFDPRDRNDDVRDVEMPCTPQKVWRILQAATQNGS